MLLKASAWTAQWIQKCRHYSVSYERNPIRHILLSGLPALTTIGDIQRAISPKLEGVVDVKLDYARFQPTGKAYIFLKRPSYLRQNLRALRNFTLCGLPVQAVAFRPELVESVRSRGDRGREEALERGTARGTGPGASFPLVGRAIRIIGFPGKFEKADVEKVLEDFKLYRSEEDKTVILKVPVPDRKFTMFSQFIVAMDSASEARRVVRHLHLKRAPGWIGAPLRVEALE